MLALRFVSFMRDILSRDHKARRPEQGVRARMLAVCAAAVLVVVPLLVSSSVRAAAGQDAPATSLERAAPELHARLVAIERAQRLLIDALAAAYGNVVEANLLQRVSRTLADAQSRVAADPEGERGVAGLGARAAGLIRRAHAFHRQVVGIYATVPPLDRTRALDEAVRQYRSVPGALPDVPKDMTILYDHPFTPFVPPRPPDTEPRRALRYPSLTGFMWATHWYELAVFEPLEPFGRPAERQQGLGVVAGRFAHKLAAAGADDGYPTELPLAPAIAPGLVALHERSAAVIDNLNMMLDVITDILVHRAVPDRRAAVDEVISQFTTRDYRCVQADEWIVVALRHSIFAQGGFALHPMNSYERNAFYGGHGQHYAVRRAPPACDPE
jgi:hypothetical protein